ncbi:MAG: transcriptional regulator [Sphingopyxis sp.]
MSHKTRPCFDADALSAIAAAYPNGNATVDHHLVDHPLLSLDALAVLGEALNPTSIEYNRSDIGVDAGPDDVTANGLGIGETIRTIAENKSWAVLKNIEAAPAYRDLLHGLLDELKPIVTPRTGEMLTLQGYIFVSSPGSMTPYHFDPEHNILLNLVGHKTMHAFPAGDPHFAAQEEHEAYHGGGHRSLPWDGSYSDQEYRAELPPGRAVLMPVMAPHFVTVGAEPAISLSITWRSEWSYRESEAHAANRWLRTRGFSPGMPPRWPRHAILRTFMWRAARKLGIVG